MADLRLVANAMFNKKNDWVNIPDSEKESCFFIFNRYFSKKYPEKAYLLNNKAIDKITAMDLWYNFMKTQPYPSWFWSKSEKAEKSELNDKDYKLLLQNLHIKDVDLDYLIKINKDFILEELKWLKKSN
ncbi:MAG: hypothetical protein M0R46_13155 [Candidatus Muirbacterium halophilum]|nr:hypothetical protein [Candidatus Muirbacterium halophilum]